MAHEFRVYNDPNEDLEDDLLPEYDFNQLRSKHNPYAERTLQRKLASDTDTAEAITSEQEPQP